MNYYNTLTLAILALGIFYPRRLVNGDIISFPNGSRVCPFGQNSGTPYYEVNLDTPILLYRERYKSLYINKKGTISFNEENSGGFLLNSVINITMTSLNDNTSVPLIAPFWTFPYVEKVCYWLINDTVTIREYEYVFMTEGDMYDFNPTLMFVTTWYYNNEDGAELGAIQLLLVTDGRSSFSKFMYRNFSNLIQHNYLIGFNAGNGKDGLQLARQTGPVSSELAQIILQTYRIDGQCVAPASSSCISNSYVESCSSFLSNITTTCICYPGFTEVNGSCTDIDKCVENEHNCSDNENCINIPGSFNCSSTGDNESYSDTISFEGNTKPPLSIGEIIGVVVAVLFGLTILVSAVIAAIILRRHRKIKDMEKFAPPEIATEMRRPSLTYAGSMIKLVDLPKELKIPFGDLKFYRKMIGEGEFGSVYKAKYKGKVVAAKILKGISGSVEVRMAIEEIMQMKKFSHPSILPLIGVSVDHHFSPCIVMPFMWNGSLDQYLKKNENRQKYFFPDNVAVCDQEVDDATGKLLKMCLQIVQGMVYLASERIIHRDLAARNCMVDFNGNIKVADFGLSVSISEDKDYFRITDQIPEKLPIRWMAIESLDSLKFSEASDVWAYGITCWEVFSCGDKPYPGISNKDIIHEIKDGYQMKKPPNRACNDPIFDLMVSCWAMEPSERPNFQSLEQKVSSLLTNLTDYLPVIAESLSSQKCKTRSLSIGYRQTWNFKMLSKTLPAVQQ